MTKNALKLKCVFSKCFHGPKRERKKPLNKGLQGDFVLFELDSTRRLACNIVYNSIATPDFIDDPISDLT